MPCLTILAMALLACCATSQAAPPADGKLAPGDQLVQQTIMQLERRDSISARLRHQVSIDGHQLYGVGSYWQQGRGESLSVRLELQFAGQEASLLEVSNSRYLWVDQSLPTGRSISRVNLRQVRAEMALTPAGLEEIRPGQASWSAIEPDLAEHYGGLPTLLWTLSDNFTFLSPQAMRLALAPPAVREPMNIPVFAVVGHWKPERITELLADEDNDGAMPIEWPARLPQEVLLLVGQSDLFPYRIEYRHQAQSSAAGQGNHPPSGSNGAYQLSAEPMVLMELSDVAFNEPLAAGEFDYSPGRDAAWNDRTADRLQDVRTRRAERLAALEGKQLQ